MTEIGSYKCWEADLIGNQYFKPEEPLVKTGKMRLISEMCLLPRELRELRLGNRHTPAFKLKPTLKQSVFKERNIDAQFYWNNDRDPILVMFNKSESTVHLPVGLNIAQLYYIKRHIYQVADLTDEEFVFYNKLQREYEFDLNAFHFGPDMPIEWKKKFQELLCEFKSVWTDRVELIGRIKGYKATLKLKTDNVVSIKPYKTSQSQQETMNKITAELQAARVISPSDSEFASPSLLVPRVGGDEHLGIEGSGNQQVKDRYQDSSRWRLVVNYQELNKLLQCPRYPVPIISDVLEQVGQYKFFNSLDLIQAFHQVRLDEKSKPITSFVTSRDQFKYDSVPFGLSVSPAIFFSIYQKILCQPYKNSPPPNIVSYADDTHVCAKTWEELLYWFRYYLQIMEKYDITLKPSKSAIGLTTIKILGFILSDGRVKPDPKKVECIRHFPRPFNKKSVQSFLGLCGFYRKFTPRFSHHASPLINLTKNVPFKWSDSCEQSFLHLKNSLSDVTLLNVFDPKLETYVFTDCSSIAAGCCLAQKGKDGYLRPIAFHSKHLNDCQSRYSSTQAELYGFLVACDVWRPYLLGKLFYVVTDNHALLYVKRTTMKTAIIQRYILRLSEFMFYIIYHPGILHSIVDSISRYTPVYVGHEQMESIEKADQPWLHSGNTETDIIEQLPAFPVFICRLKITNVKISRAYINFVQTDILKKEQRKDKFCENLILQFDMETAPLITRFRLLDGILVKLQKTSSGETTVPVVPRSLIPELLKTYHDSLESGGHLGAVKVYQKLKDRFYFPDMMKEITAYIKTCVHCQYRKCKVSKTGYMHSIYFHEPFYAISFDLIGPYPMSGHCDYVITIVDYKTKFAVVEPIKGNTAQTIAKTLVNKVFFLFGLCRVTFSDQAPQHMGNVFTQVFNMMGIERRVTVSHRPQMDGQTERAQKTFIQMLKNYMNEKQTVWKGKSKPLQYLYNSTAHSTTGFPPFEQLFGVKPVTLGELELEHLYVPTDPVAKNIFKRMKEVREEAKFNTFKAQAVMRHHYNKRRKPARIYKIGDQVLYHYKTIKPKKCPHWSKKLCFHARGVYQIVRKLPDRDNYVIKLQMKKKHMALRELTVNSDQIVPFYTRRYDYRVWKPKGEIETIDQRAM